MLPTYQDGEVLLVARGRTPRPGVAAVVRLPDNAAGVPRPLSVKRITGPDPHDPARWWFESDNAAEGVTAYDTGPLTSTDVVAVVLCRVSPRWGRLSETGSPS